MAIYKGVPSIYGYQKLTVARIFSALVTQAVPTEERNIGYIVGTVVSVIVLAVIVMVVAFCWYVFESFMQVFNVGI